MTALLHKAAIAWGLARTYLRGWRSRQKLVVIESDDWGAIRVSSREAYDRLSAAGCPMDRSHYNLDALETPDDLDRLFEVLDAVRDRGGRPACLTANTIVANPDFAAIRAAEFRHYSYEPVTATLARDPERRGLPARWADGAQRGLYAPQFHGREHVAWWQWLEALRAGSAETRLAMDLGMWGVHLVSSREGLCFNMPLYVDDAQLARYGVDLEAMIREGADLFERQFGFRSLSTIAPNYAWTDRAERAFAAAGIRYIQGSVQQSVPTPAGPVRRLHHLGERNVLGGLYLVRNAYFEPAEPGVDWVARCLRQVTAAFAFRTPAIIGTHRVNYIGSIDPANRDRGLAALRQLLAGITARWPDAIFLSSPELGLLIEHGDDVLESGESAIVGDRPAGG